MPQSNLSFEQRNLHGPVTSTPKNCIHQVLITYTGCHHVIIYSTHNSKRQDGYGFIGENGYIFHESSRCIEVLIGGAYTHMFEDLLQVISYNTCLSQILFNFMGYLLPINKVPWVCVRQKADPPGSRHPQ